MSIFKKIFKSDNDRNLAKLEKIAKLIENKADYYKNLTDEQLKETTVSLKQRVSDGEKLDAVLPDAFALVREASDRVLGLRHFYVQLLGGIALFQGRIAEMKTGEGKTLVETLPAFLQALEGKGVHIVTVNEYLARRDAEWMGKIFVFLGLTVGVNLNELSPEEKRNAYNCDITYSTNSELGFDYLRDNMVVRLTDRVCRGYNFAIVDEVDSILIDEARTPLIISGRGMKSSEAYKTAAKFAKSLKQEDYEIDEKERGIRLTETGISKAERFYNVPNIGDIENIELNHHINNAIRAQYIMKRDNNYIVQDGEVFIVDEFTGRIMKGRRYASGMHQAIEAKEGLQIQDENQTLATITLQNLFRLYGKLSGMTGTAKTEETEFNKIYTLDVVQIPTNLPTIRKDYSDIIYKTEKAKFNAIIDDIKQVHSNGRPILVGTITIEKSEKLSDELKKHRISHYVLNAKNHQQESEIIAQAGRLGSVTIATNMAGRGTDILLGGNPEFLAKQKMRELGVNDAQLEYCTSITESGNEELNELRRKYRKFLAEYKALTDKEKQQVVDLGGLHIIGTERHEARRIDNQLRGRSGRQGDPGSTVFYISMEDDLLRKFGGETMQKFMNFMHIADDVPLQYKMLSKRIEAAQRRIEGINFSQRHNVLSFDDVLNKQRSIIYEERNKVLMGADVHDEILDMMRELVTEAVLNRISDDKLYDEWDLEDLNNALNGKIFDPDTNFVTYELVEGKESEEVAQCVIEEVIRQYEEKCKLIVAEGIDFHTIERDILLRNVDKFWIEHIDYMEMLKNEIGLRAYGNYEPAVVYKKEGFEVFDKMINNIRENTALYLIRGKVSVRVMMPRQNINMVTNVDESGNAKSKKLVGRNELCPCGSGKKFKHCCGKN